MAKNEMTQSTESNCTVCGTSGLPLRRERCPTCYIRWAEKRPIGKGSSCCVCGDRRREHLTSAEIQHQWHTFCHNCSTRAMKMDPPPRTIDSLRENLSRDRRHFIRRLEEDKTAQDTEERRAQDRRVEKPAGLNEQWEDAENLIINLPDWDNSLEADTKIYESGTIRAIGALLQ